MKSRESQRRNSMKSPYRGIKNARDQGQRYEVRYQDGLGTERIFGFTNDAMQAHRMMMNVRRNWRWSNVRIIDRQMVLKLEAAGG